MPLAEQLSSLLARFRARRWRRNEPIEEDPSSPSATEPALDPAEEFLKIQRGLRRLSLASDRSGEILNAVSGRLNDVQQTLLNMSRPQHAALTLDEMQLLRLLDQMDRLASVPDLPSAAGPLLQEMKASLLVGARWQPIALTGMKPGGADIRIAEYLGGPDADAHGEARIERILEQGYRRADGTLLRPGVVIAAAAAHFNQTFS